MAQNDPDHTSGAGLTLSRFREWIRSEQTKFGALAGGDLFFHILDNPQSMELYDVARPLIDWLANSPLVGGILTVLATSATDLGSLAQATQWILYIYVVYIFTPALYPSGFGEWRKNVGTRLLTVWMVAATVLAATSIEIVLIFLTGVTTFTTYLTWDDDPLFTTTSKGSVGNKAGAAKSILETLGVTTEQETSTYTIDTEAGGLHGSVAKAVMLFIVTSIISIMCIIFGGITIVLGLFFPFLELTVLGWTAYTVVGSRTSHIPLLSDWNVDVEASYHRALTNAFSSGNPVKGMFTIITIVTGAGLSAIPFVLATAALGLISVQDVGTVFGLNESRAVAALLSLLSLATFGMYGLWFWKRVSQRLPAFLRHWDGSETKPEHTRPVGNMVPPLFLLFISSAVWFAGALILHQNPTLNLWPQWFVFLSILLHLLGFAAVGWSVTRTLKLSSQCAGTDNRAIPLAYGIQVLGPALFLNILSNYIGIKEGGIQGWIEAPLFPGDTFNLATLLVLLLLCMFFYMVDLLQYAEGNQGPQRIAAIGGIIAPPILLFVVAGSYWLPKILSQTGIVLVIIAGVILVMTTSKNL